MQDIVYKQKYLKYKAKYLELKKGGGGDNQYMHFDDIKKQFVDLKGKGEELYLNQIYETLESSSVNEDVYKKINNKIIELFENNEKTILHINYKINDQGFFAYSYPKCYTPAKFYEKKKELGYNFKIIKVKYIKEDLNLLTPFGENCKVK
jgi:hypothetical protein